MSQWDLEEFTEKFNSASSSGKKDQMVVVFSDLEASLAVGYQGANRVVFVGAQLAEATGFKTDSVQLETDLTFTSNLLEIDRAFRITFECRTTEDVECAFAICVGLRLLVQQSAEGLSLSAIERFVKGAFNKSSIQQEVGLFGELVTILIARDPLKAITAWHADNFDTYDFGNQLGYLEVKTTASSTRSHWLSSGQISKVPAAKVTIASFVVNLIPDGTSVLDLIEMILDGLSGGLVESFTQKVGKYPLNEFTRRFDLESAKDSLRLYALADLPVSFDLTPGVLNQKWLIDFGQAAALSKGRKLPFKFSQ
jgi:hypothetical protein